MGRHIMYRDRSDEEFVASVVRHVEAINHALRDIPAERVRLHLCWGNYEGPHHLDIELEQIIPAILAAKPTTILFEAANPRHAHEFVVWRDVVIPEDKILAPGVLDSTTNYIEHPELVAQRILRFVDLVGPGRVMAGTDCGFGTAAGMDMVVPSVTWAKFRSQTEGAKIASDYLWGTQP